MCSYKLVVNVRSNGINVMNNNNNRNSHCNQETIKRWLNIKFAMNNIPNGKSNIINGISNIINGKQNASEISENVMKNWE